MKRGIKAHGLIRWTLLALVFASASAALASEFHGIISYHGIAVPGATVTLTQGSRKYVTVTDTQGFYTFPAASDGPGTISVVMTGFSPLQESVTVAADAALARFELKQLSLEELRAQLKPVPSAPVASIQARSEPKKTGEAPKIAANQPPAAPAEEVAQRAMDGLLVNGSVNNAATSQFSLGPRFGNTTSGKSLYNFMLNLRVSDSALDARSYSIAGIDTTKPATSDLTGGFALQGPLKIPHLLKNGPNIFIGYQRTRNSDSISTPALVPTLAQRAGDLSHVLDATGQPVVIYGASGQPIASNAVPISPQAQALLDLYPLPNVTGNALYNYQIPIVTDIHQDSLDSNASKTLGRKNQITGSFSARSTRTSYNTLLNFTDATNGLGLASNINWSHTFNAHLRSNVGYQFSRQSQRVTPFWQNRANISAQAGISGNDQDPTYWGPPTLRFSNGITPLSDAQSSFTRDVTNGLSLILRWNHSPHNISAGFDLRRQQFNYLTQANPRGTFTFTGATTAAPGALSGGSDFADFLLGRPDASAIAYGNADKYLRESVADLFITDDWRVTPQLTLNLGVRWEYGAPVTERKNRLVNLDVASGFAAVAPVVAGTPSSTLTGRQYPTSLLEPDRTGIEPRLALSWRPIAGSSLVVSAGYGVNSDTSVYQGLALQMAQQAPLSRSLTLQNSVACPLTLANGFIPCATTTAQTFGVDPNFRVGLLHTWNLKVQKDLPGSLQFVATYLGNKGLNGVQEFLPNTYAPGAINPCPSCPTGFIYLTSTGTSSRESGQLQLRRRLKSGFTASALYTFSKSLDDDSALGGQGAATLSSASIAQDWRNLRAERGLSSFDQRHLLNVQVQYTTGMGKGGGSLMSGWRGRAYKEWTVQTQIDAGSGLPETPFVAASIVSGYSSIIRPDVTGASIHAAPAGRSLNPGAYIAPLPGQFGNARRNSITGPNQFLLNAAMLRTFRLPHKLNLDVQVAASNAINHVSYSSWVTNINSPQFGLPAAARSMRSLQTSLRLRF